VNVLWGLAAMTLDGQCTAAEVEAKFREAMKLDDWSEANLKQTVDLYRLVPVTDHVTRLAEQEQVLVHLPGSRITCDSIEDVYRQLEEAETRCQRAQESVVALVEAMQVSEASSNFDSSRAVASKASDDLQRMRQENVELRQQLEAFEYARRLSEQRAQLTEESQALLSRDLSQFRQEVTPRRPAVRQVGGLPFGPVPTLHFQTGAVAPAPQITTMAATCLATSQPGSNPVTPRTTQFRIQARPPGKGASATAAPGPIAVSQARMPYGGGFSSADRSNREPLSAAAPQHAPMNSVGATAAAAAAALAGRNTPTAKVKVNPVRITGMRG